MWITKNFQGVGTASHPRLSGAVRRTIGTTEPEGAEGTTEGEGDAGTAEAEGEIGTTEPEGEGGATEQAPSRVTAITVPAARRIDADAYPSVTG